MLVLNNCLHLLKHVNPLSVNNFVLAIIFSQIDHNLLTSLSKQPARCCGTRAERLTHHHKIVGLNPAASTQEKESGKKYQNIFLIIVIAKS
jgi:hypothetical protein